MFNLKSVLIGLLVMVSCNCQNKVKTSDVTSQESVKGDFISAILQEKNYDILEQANLIVDYEIRKQLLQGTKDEYSNKLFLKDTLSQTDTKALLSLLKDDTSYDWSVVPSENGFEPTKQLLVKSKVGRLNLLIDEGFTRMSFINLDGQKLIHLSKEFTSFLKKM